MGGGALEPKTVAGVSKKAFTLAEVLITLAIIGVVAALTIPTVVAKYQQKALYTQFMKTFNTLSNAVSMAVAENGALDTWGFSATPYRSHGEILNEKLAPYLKISKIIDESDSEYDYPISYLNGESTYEDYYTGETKNHTSEWNIYSGNEELVAVLSDGAIVAIYGDYGHISVGFDTNGLKGPNVIGRDIFHEAFCYDKLDNGKYLAIPCMMNTGSGVKSREELEEGFHGDDAEFACSPDKPGGDVSCAARLMLEGKMDY